MAEAGELFAAAGVELAEAAVVVLQERTEGWAAGLRLAALSLAGHSDPERFAAEFSGSERTVAEYLLAEVLDRQSEAVRRLLLRTSVLDRVNGELADLLTGAGGGERVLQDLEQANAFVVSLDAGRSWFRYQQMFAGLLALELRRTAPDEVAGLHQAAAGWLAGHGYPVEAIRHAQAARDWELAARLLAGHWPALYLDGQDTTIHELIAGFPSEVFRAADAELAAVAAGLAGEGVAGGGRAAPGPGGAGVGVGAGRPARAAFQVLLGIVRLLLARQRSDLPAAAEEARRLLAIAEAPDAAQPALGQDLRAWRWSTSAPPSSLTARFDGGRSAPGPGPGARAPDRAAFLEFGGLAYQATAEVFQSFAVATEHSTQAIDWPSSTAGWTSRPQASPAWFAGPCWSGREDRSRLSPGSSAPNVPSGPKPSPRRRWRRASPGGMLELACGRDAEALAAFQAADRLAGRLAEPNLMVLANRSFLVQTLVRLGETERAEQTLAGLSDQDRERGEIRSPSRCCGSPRTTRDAAMAALAPVLDSCRRRSYRRPGWLRRPAGGDRPGRARRGGRSRGALERALDLAEPDGVLLLFLL